MKYILASGSPRRHDLLKEVVSNFEIIPSHVEEVINNNLDIFKIAMDVSRQKAIDVNSRHKDDLIIGADTIVYCNGEILLKPKDYDDAFRILKLLSNNPHSVITGVTLCYKDRIYSFYDETKIMFTNMDDKWINNYIKENKPYDKSGSYGIQEISNKYIEYIDGEINNVIGLPTKKLKCELEQFLKSFTQ